MKRLLSPQGWPALVIGVTAILSLVAIAANANSLDKKSSDKASPATINGQPEQSPFIETPEPTEPAKPLPEPIRPPSPKPPSYEPPYCPDYLRPYGDSDSVCQPCRGAMTNVYCPDQRGLPTY